MAESCGDDGPKLGRWKVMGLKEDGGGREGEGGRAKGEGGRGKQGGRGGNSPPAAGMRVLAPSTGG